MLIGGIVLGLVLGLVAGGSIWNLASVRLRRLAFIAAAVLIRFATEAAIAGAIPFAESLRLPLYALAYVMLLVGLWPNRTYPGISLAFVGILANGIAIAANGGHMPVWQPSLLAAGIGLDDVRSSFQVVLPPALDAAFLVHAGPLADLIPIPFPIVRNVASIGDLFLSSGLAFFLFATVLHSPEELDDAEMDLIQQRLRGVAVPRRGHGTATALRESRVRPETALASAAVVAGVPVGEGVFRPLGTEAVAAEVAGAVAAIEAAITRPVAPPFLERARRHPYVRLALNGSFSALWTGQLISLFGDRVHQVAIALLVLQATHSPLAVAAIFIAATIPNLFVSPVAGTFVDRWDHHDVLVVSDLLRAALVLAIPVAAVTNLVLVYPLTFLVACISVFFRPARVAVLPRIVHEDDLVTANSLSWMAETLADVVGYPVAGLFVAFLGAALPLAFWLDAATYVASAALLWTIVVPAIARPDEELEVPRNFAAELRDGWRFLRREPVLLANTIQATVGQFTVGVVLALTPIYVVQTLGATDAQFPAYYGFLETGAGIGNLVGGFLIGLVGARLARGRTVIVGYAVAGACIALLALTGNLAVAFGLLVGAGVANMVFVIPSQTLFQLRTPPELMGRVVGLRFAIVFGSMTLAMAVGGVLGELFGAAVVIGAFGVLTLLAGLAGLLVPAVRDA
jgi:DHA3 family macrolide efflux protein-like MFS transporter